MKVSFLRKIVLASLLMPGTMMAQRMQQPLGRGVVAVYGTSNGSAAVEITWRRLAQEPEDAQYNVYVSKTADGEYKQLNSKPLATTNFATTLTKVPYGSYVAVGIEGREGLSKPFLFKNNGLRNIYMEINYAKAGSPLKSANYTTKFVWPCDLNGDGEYDYVVDRCPVDGSRNYYVEGYLADGTFLWNVDLGVNEKPCDGQNDNMCAYDIDCDGYGELIVQTSDGTRFWNKEAGTWGKYLFGKDTGDSDGDKIIDYDTQTVKNPPRYMTVVDGMTGAEKASCEFMYDDAYNRTNKAQLMGDEYNKHEAHVGIAYLDGVHPAIVGEWLSRDTNKAHHYRNCAFQYVNGVWKQLFMKNIGGAEFHMIRIFDADGDGKDEMSSGAYVMDHDGSTLYNTGISHGDRHRTSDIDPERPGLETFSIQQNAPDMLGMILFDAGTGEPIKKWYLPAVGDVGRGECADLDPSHLGWEMFSTMDGYQMYDAKGNKIEGKTGFFPTESMWWDGDLGRERLDTPDGNGYNAMIVDYQNGRLIEMAKESGWTLQSTYGKRAKYWGDIIGDWREEVILNRVVDNVCQGIVGFSTDYKTTVGNIYCLQQDPHYRGDCTTRGYYQTPCPGFYLGYDMPRPQLPPCMVADDETAVYGIADGNKTITSWERGVKNIYAMPVKGQTLTLNERTEHVTLWKGQQGTLVIKAPHYSVFPPMNGYEHIIISEGKVVLDDLWMNYLPAGIIDLRARGTLAGGGLIDSLACEGALNYEGCRLIPYGRFPMSINNISLPKGKNLYVEITPGAQNNYIEFYNKNQTEVKGNIIFTFNEDLEPGRYTLIDGGNIDPAQCKVRGLVGKSYSFEVVENKNLLTIEGLPVTCTKGIVLVVHEQREATTGVAWIGNENTIWDYQTNNFSLNGETTNFVAGDEVEIGDAAVKTTISLPVLYPTGGVTFTGSKKFTVNGNGGFSGEGGLTVDMDGSVTLNAVHSDYTGKTRLLNGTITVKEIADDGIESSLGAGKQIEMARAKLIINNTNSGTNRTVQLTDTATIQIASGSASLKGLVSGNGTLLKAGNGQLNITYAGANTWKETILQAGTLAMGAWNTTFGKATSPIHVTGNSTITVFNNNSTSAVPQFKNAVTIDKGKTLTFHAGQRCSIAGSLKGEGTYKIDFPYVRGDVSTNCSQFEGTYQVTTSNCRFTQAMDLSKATLQLDEGSYAAGFTAGSGNETSYTHKIGTLTGTGTLGTGTWQVAKVVSLTSPLTINGTLKLSKATLDVTALCKKKLSDNAELKLFTLAKKATITGELTILPASPKDGWEWDTSTLATDGVLRIKELPDAIEAVNAEDTGKTVYDLSGRRVSNPAHGIYIINGHKTVVK